MKLGILICDQVRESLLPEHGDYPEMFVGLFERLAGDVELGRGLQITYEFYHVMKGELPTAADDCDAYLATGSKYSVNDDSAWIHQLVRFIQQLYDNNTTFVGICFGHQLIARALGGNVINASQGWGVGLSQCEVLRQQPWMLPYQSHVDIVVSHQDQIAEPPPAGQVLMGTGFCPVSVIQVGNHFLGIQGHPEFSRAYAKDLMLCRQDTIPSRQLASAIDSLSRPVDDLLMARWIMNFLNYSKNYSKKLHQKKQQQPRAC